MDILIWLLIAWLIFGGSGSKKKKPQQPQQTNAEQRRMQRQNRERTIIFGDLGEFIREFKDLMDVENVPEIEPKTEWETEPKRRVEPVSEQPVFSEMSSEDIARRKRELAEKRRRRLNTKQEQPVRAAAEADECEYCTGEVAVEQGLQRTAAAKPVVLAERPIRDVATACRELQLNELQQAVVWAEVLDKPLALRRRR